MTDWTYFVALWMIGAVSVTMLVVPLRRKLRAPLVLSILGLTAALAVASLPVSLIDYEPLSQSSFLGALLNTSLLLGAGVVTLHLLTGTRYLQLLFLMLIVKSYGEYTLTISLVAQQTFFPARAELTLLFMVGIYAVTLPLVLLFLIKLVRPLMEEGGKLPFWNYLWVVPMGFYAVYCLGIYTNYLGVISLTATLAGLTIMLFWTLGTFGTYVVMVKMLSITVVASRMQERLALSELQMEMQLRRLEAIQSSIEEARRAKHDLRHHINTLRGLLQRGDLDKMAEYLDQYAASLPDAQQTFCENPSVDAILGYYAALCDSSRIRYQFTARLPQSLGGKEQDVCAVLSNLLENACEACARQAQGPRTLEVKAALSGQDMLAITVHNSYGGRVETDSDGLFYSSKRPGKALGIGTQSVRSIAAHSGGLARFSHTEQTFTASVLLHL